MKFITFIIAMIFTTVSFAHDSCGNFKGKMLGPEGRIYELTTKCEVLLRESNNSVGCYGPVSCKHTMTILNVMKKVRCDDQVFLVVKGHLSDGRGNRAISIVVVNEEDIINF